MYSLEGRYENTTEGHNKFWELEDMGDGTFKATWGRIGFSQGEKIYDAGTANKKVAEKLGKGYIKVEGAKPIEMRDRKAAKQRMAEKRDEIKGASEFMRELRKIAR